jgi:hypothetical protein
MDLVKLKNVLTKYKVPKASIKKILEEFESKHINLVNGIIKMKRFHKNIETHVSESESRILSDVANLAEVFCMTFDLDLEPGFDKYITIGLELMGSNYALSKFKYYNEKIYNVFTQRRAIESDKNPKITSEIIRIYCNKCNISAEEINNIYRHDFCFMIRDAFALNREPLSWLNTQFIYFEKFNKVPEPYQLHGFEATKRVLTSNTQTNDWRNKAKASKN